MLQSYCKQRRFSRREPSPHGEGSGEALNVVCSLWILFKEGSNVSERLPPFFLTRDFWDHFHYFSARAHG